jgi:selenide,water dikinase
MKQINIRRDLVLVGGGHSHALALRQLTMRPPDGTRITLISDSSFAPYSGMLPGLVAGHYSFRQSHIDLRRFCTGRGVRFVEAAVTGIDVTQRKILLVDRPPLDYDVLSINIGAQPELDSVPGARDHATPVKPVSRFYRRWQALAHRLRSESSGASIVVVGGGAGSVELALAMRHRLGPTVAISLLCGECLLPSYNAGARARVEHYCDQQKILVREQCRVVEVAAGRLATAAGEKITFDELVWCTGVVPASWLQDTGLSCDHQGFLRVDEALQCWEMPGVFAAGDVAMQEGWPRPRAGVFAVRQAPVLAHNLAAALEGRRLRRYRPQDRFLSLLSLGDKLAVADRGHFHASGGWVWRWKDRIDRNFMARFSEAPPAMPAPAAVAQPPHCGGCGAKLPGRILHDVLSQLITEYPEHIAVASLGEDAAVMDWPADHRLVQSVDTLRALVSDPWEMGRILALHALSDLYACGATPHSALVQLGLPYAAEPIQRRELYQLMSGILRELRQAGATLVGGHTLEGEELSLGLTVNGSLTGQALNKQSVQPGDRLVLTKPLGTGVVFAAAMNGQAPGDAIAEACASMLNSNRDAAELATHCGATACTDVTGFGLLGHLLEMVSQGDTMAWLSPQQLPVLCGADQLLEAGFRSTLHTGNLESLPAALQPAAESLPVLCDPQTSGGLLISIPQASLDRLTTALTARGCEAAIIGGIEQREVGKPGVEIR